MQITMQVRNYTFLLMVSHYSIEVQVVVMCEEMSQCTSKVSEVEDHWRENMDINNAGCVQ